MMTKIEIVTPWNLSVRIDAGKPASAVYAQVKMTTMLLILVV